MTDYSQVERLALCDLFDQVGPDQPTLCAGWSTHDLAAHLWVRESDPVAGPGIMIPALADTTERRMTGAKTRWTFTELVDRVRNGPPTVSIFNLPVLGPQLNVTEYFVHHEDVRRAVADFQVRALPDDQQAGLWKMASLRARSMLRKASSGVVLRTPDGREAVAKKPTAAGSVTITGEPAELVLFCFGRQSVAQVDLDGDPELTAQLQNQSFGV
ncbi:TIGR03085 family metal-binding protein [Kribbella sp. NPDC051770]|uniref:TIGR03085 family metal-binding protein n=1 Tax=Kribbella sp. NPDC051770 TaxID=3155413 RepID=UPI003436A420